MPYEEKRSTVALKKPHNLTMEGRRQLSLTGVEEVERFDEQEISLTTSCGSLIVRGAGLSIGKLSVDAGDVNISGEIDSLSYEETGRGKLWSRLFR